MPGSYVLAGSGQIMDPAGNSMDQDGDGTQGDAVADGLWTDRVLIEQVGVANPERAKLGKFQYHGRLSAGLPYSRTEQLRLPTHIQGACRVVVTSDFLDELYERPGSEANNVGVSDPPTAIRVNARLDLRVEASSIDAVAEIPAGGLISVSYEVRNQGRATTAGKHWVDRVYLSLDPHVSLDDMVLVETPNASTLGLGESYSVTTPSVVVQPLDVSVELLASQ